MEHRTPHDWFLPAIDTNGSVQECLAAVQGQLESRSSFIASLRSNLGGQGSTDAVTSISLRLKAIENTLRFRLGILRAERPGAWFRPSAATHSGPFSSSIVAEPVFAMYDVANVKDVEETLKKRWLSSRSTDLPFANQDPCLWRSLLSVKSELETLCILDVPFQEYRLDRLPDGLPQFVESPSLRAFLLNVRTEILSIRDRLDVGYEQIWLASQRLWTYQRKRLHDDASSQRSPNRVADQVRNEFRQRRQKMPSLRSGQDSEALGYMGFEDFPSSDVLRQRYRELAKQWHPDLQQGREEEFKMLNRAYRHLTARVGSA